MPSPRARTPAAAAITVLLAAACQREGPALVDALAAQRLLARLDDACNARDYAGYADHFEPGNRCLHDSHLAYMRQLLVPERTFHRHSTLTSHLERDGRGVALVHVDYRHQQHAPTSTAAWDGYLVLRPTTGPLPKVQFAVPVDPMLIGMVDGPQFRCDACNYSVGAPGPWLVVPIPRQQTGCMEDVAFYDLQNDLQVTTSVWIGERAHAATDALRVLLACRDASAQIEPWPAAHASLSSPHLTTAQCRFTQADRVTTLRLVVHGRVHYLLTVDGTAAALAERSRQVTQLIDSFRLLDDRSPEATQRGSAEAHLGAHVDTDNVFSHRSGVTFRGPPAWRPELEHGPNEFEIGFHCPEQRGTLWASAVAIGGGAGTQRRRHADLIIDRSLEGRGLAATTDSGWQIWTGAPHAAQRRQLVCGTDATRQHAVRAILTDKLLIVFEWNVETAVAATIETSLQTLVW